MCYRFHFNSHENETHSYYVLGYAEIYANVLFILKFQDSFIEKVRVSKIVIGENGPPGIPENSIGYSNYYYHNYSMTKRSNYALIVDYTFHTQNLPALFKTNCIDFTRYDFWSNLHCNSECIIKLSTKALNKIPFLEILTLNSDF